VGNDSTVIDEKPFGPARGLFVATTGLSFLTFHTFLTFPHSSRSDLSSTNLDPMLIRGMIFDIDGTLVDTNMAHVEAWRRAFTKLGYDVDTSRIIPEIGKGGDKLVPSVIGEEGERRNGEALRRRQKEEFFAIASSLRFKVFPGTREVFPALRARGIRTALATSSDANHLDATLDSAGVDLRRLADIVVTKDKDEPSKPSPALVVDAVEALALPPDQCAMVGDTVYDGEACRQAGVAFLGVLSGGTSRSALLEAGARGVWNDVATLLADLDGALKLLSPDAATHP
jgi:phosphoglycolate phosphatase-like HAD superfamily hydrolase